MEKETRKQMENEAYTGLKEIFEEIERIRERIKDEPMTYVSKQGEEFCECCGAYNDYMVRAMAHDMFHFQLVLHGKYPELTDMSDGWIIKMSRFNYRLLRMMDDDAGNRPMQNWPYKKTCKFVNQIKKVIVIASEIYGKDHNDLLEDFIKHCTVWAVRVVYMNTWAFYLQNLRDNKDMMTQSQIEMYDNDGNKISGLDEEGQKFMKAICTIRTELTKMIVKIPCGSKDYHYIMDKLERFEMIGEAIMKDIEI